MKGGRLLAEVAAPALSLALALLLGALLIVMAGRNPLSIYAELLKGTLGSWYGIGQTLSKATPLLFTGLSVGIAFRAGLFNIGAEGQMVMGGLAAALAGLAYPRAPGPLLLLLSLSGAAAAGAATAAIPGWLRSSRGVHEVIGTLMMNFIALALAGTFMQGLAVAATVRTETLPEGDRLPRLSALADLLRLDGLSQALRPSPASIAILLGLVAAALVWWLLFRTVTGYQMRAVGLNPAAAAAAGIPVGERERISFYLSGALAGLGATGFVLGHKYFYETGFTAGAGFMGIAVALLGRNHPGGIVLAALLFGALSQGGLVVNAEIPREIVDVLQAVVILALIASFPLFRAWAGRPGGG